MNRLLILYVLASPLFLAPSYAAESGSAMAQLGGFNPGQEFPMPETPSVPQMPLPFMPPSDPHPFFTTPCMAYCPYGFDDRLGAGTCACRDPFSGFNAKPDVCAKICIDGSFPSYPCVCPGDPQSGTIASELLSGRGKRSAKASAGVSKSLASFLEGSSTATVTCGGVEYSIFAFPMNCGMGTILPPDWLETAASYSAWHDARARQPLLKEAALRHFLGSGNEAAATAVAERSSRIFSDGAVLFVAAAGKMAVITDGIAARRVYENTFTLADSEKARGDLGVHKDVVRGVLACMASDACWEGADGGRD